jgi:CheY-like chemotaxis protein
MKDKLILIVDDDDSVRKSTARCLRLCGFKKVVQATNGQDAIGIITELLPDLVITDLNMPGMRGEELIAWICREHKPTHPAIKIIAQSGGDPDTMAVRVKDAGGDAFLPKQSGLADLESAIVTLLA